VPPQINAVPAPETIRLLPHEVRGAIVNFLSLHLDQHDELWEIFDEIDNTNAREFGGPRTWGEWVRGVCQIRGIALTTTLQYLDFQSEPLHGGEYTGPHQSLMQFTLPDGTSGPVIVEEMVRSRFPVGTDVGNMADVDMQLSEVAAFTIMSALFNWDGWETLPSMVDVLGLIEQIGEGTAPRNVTNLWGEFLRDASDPPLSLDVPIRPPLITDRPLVGRYGSRAHPPRPPRKTGDQRWWQRLFG